MKYYLTTPIYYVNAAPHIGHAYTTIAADTIRRLKRMQGFDVVMTTAPTTRPEDRTRRRGRRQIPQQEFTDVFRANFAGSGQFWASRSIAFERTTSERTQRVVQDLFKRCLDDGYVYKGAYTGQYCVFDELYVNDAKPGDPCPDCGRTTETVTEENYTSSCPRFSRSFWICTNRSRISFCRKPRATKCWRSLSRACRISPSAAPRLNGAFLFRAKRRRVLCLVRCVDHVHQRCDGEGLWARGPASDGKEIVRFHAVLLAGVFDGRGSSAAQAHFRAWMAAV